MDPELLKAARMYFDQVAKAHAAGDKPTATERENYARMLTGGSHGYADMEALKDTLGDDSFGAAAQNVLQGLTMNFGDELAGVIGGESAKEGMRLRDDFLQRERPVVSALGQMGGGAIGAMLLPGGAAKEVTLGKKVLSGMKLGAAFGAANGAGSGEDLTGRLEGGAIGGVVGGTLGAAIPRIAGSRIAGSIGRRVSAATGAAMSPLEESYAKLGGVRTQLEKAIEAMGGYRAAHAANDALEAGGRGEIATFADLGSPTTDLADFAATNSSAARKAINDVVEPRSSSTTARVAADFKDAAGEHHAESRIAQLAAETKAWADGPDAYGTRLNGVGLHGANPMVPLGDAEPLVSQPRIKNMFATAKQTAEIGPDAQDLATQAMNEARTANPELDKFLAANPKLNVANVLSDPDAIAQLEALGKGHLVAALKSADGKAPFDVVQDLHGSLEDAASAAFRRGANNLGFKLSDSADVVRRTLEETIPGYADIVDRYSARKGLETAVKLGQEWFHKGDMIGLQQVVESLKDKPLLLEEFRKGLAAEQLKALNRQTGENAAAKLMIAKNNLPQQQMNEIVFGNKATYDDFLVKAKAERQLGYLSSAGKGSQTTPRAVRNSQALGVAGQAANEVVNQSPSFLHAAKKAVVKATIGSMLEKRADELTPQLLTTGHKSIAELLDMLERTSARARVGAGSTRVAPGALTSLFGNARSQD